MLREINRKQFEASPALVIERTIKEYVATSPANRLPTFNVDPIFDEPLIAFADGDDAIFQEYKRIIGEYHLTPREVLEKHLQSKGGKGVNSPSKISVISWVLPITRETRLSLRREARVTSLRWHHTRWYGQQFIDQLSQYVVSFLERMGHQAVAPELADFFHRELTTDLTSNWSQRHIAYAAGLGTFSLSDGLITPGGIAMRSSSVVTDLALPPSPRTYENHLANCLFYPDKACRRCIERCPAGAISEQGHDKKKCYDFIVNKQWAIMRELGRKKEDYGGKYFACGLCQTGVPCEDRIPPRQKKKQ